MGGGASCHVDQWMVDPTAPSRDNCHDVWTAMDDAAEPLAITFTSGMVIRGCDSGDWIKLVDEPGYVHKSRMLAKMEHWLVGTAAVPVFSSTSLDSEVICTKASGTIVRGYGFECCCK